MKCSPLLVAVTYLAVNGKAIKGARLGRALKSDSDTKKTENGTEQTINNHGELQSAKTQFNEAFPSERLFGEKKAVKIKITARDDSEFNWASNYMKDSNSLHRYGNMNTMPGIEGELDCSFLFDQDFEEMPKLDMQQFSADEDIKFIYKKFEKKVNINGQTTEYWYGEQAGDNNYFIGTMNIIKNNEDRSIVGSVTTADMVYRINTDFEGKINVIGTLQNDYPDEDDTPVVENDEGADRVLVTTSENGMATDMLKGGEHNVVRHLDSSNSIDILVVYTREAMCSEANNGRYSSSCTENFGPIERLIDLAVQETNTAYANSGINTRLNLVHKYMDPDYVEVKKSGTHLSDLRKTNDGKLDSVHRTRDLYGADLVHMIVATGGAGIGHLKSSATTAFSVSNIYAATGYFTFGHEIGHNFGCWHNRKNSAAQIDYGHGYQDPQRSFRSIMAYNCPNGGCPRVQHFSNPNKYYQRKPTGTSTENCVRLINERASTVANFRQHNIECNDSVQGWHDSDSSTYNCAWYASVDSYCGDYGDSYRNFGKTANEACCDCGGGLASECIDEPNWHDADGPLYDCAWFASKDSYCSTYGDMGENFGKTANEACCVCRGGN